MQDVPQNRMKIVTCTRVGIAGGSYGPGEIVDVSANDARLLIGIGKARLAEAAPASDAPAGLTTEAADALVPETRKRRTRS